jgi:hypothetical protein
MPYLVTAAKLAVPRALLGVMIAQWLATGTGLDNLLDQARGYLDDGTVWTVAAVSVLLPARDPDRAPRASWRRQRPAARLRSARQGGSAAWRAWRWNGWKSASAT